MKLNRLSDLAVKKSKPAAGGRSKFYGDGGNLWLQVSGDEREPARSWVFRYTRSGRERYMGLGPYPTITLRVARDKAAGIRRSLLNGKDPFNERRAIEIAATLEAGKGNQSIETDLSEKNSVEHMRVLAKDYHPGTGSRLMIEEAADRMELQDARIKALEAALGEYADPNNWNTDRNMWARSDDPVFLAEFVLSYGGKP